MLTGRRKRRPLQHRKNLPYISEQERQRKEKLKTMQHLDEIIAAALYARNACPLLPAKAR